MMTTIVTTCKGRLRELCLSVESWLHATPCRILIISDGCPELEAEPRPEAPVLRDARVLCRFTGAAHADHFSKPRALNFGASVAADMAAPLEPEHLLFLDSDTRVHARFWDWYARRVTPDALFIVPPSPEDRDLTGVLGVSAAEFLAVGGADEGFVGWGSEDLDLRLRLFLARTLRIIEIPTNLLSAIPHADAQRTRYYAEQDKMASHRRNLQRLVDNAERLTGESIWSLLESPQVKRLFGTGLGPMARR